MGPAKAKTRIGSWCVQGTAKMPLLGYSRVTEVETVEKFIDERQRVDQTMEGYVI